MLLPFWAFLFCSQNVFECMKPRSHQKEKTKKNKKRKQYGSNTMNRPLEYRIQLLKYGCSVIVYSRLYWFIFVEQKRKLNDCVRAKIRVVLLLLLLFLFFFFCVLINFDRHFKLIMIYCLILLFGLNSDFTCARDDYI